MFFKINKIKKKNDFYNKDLHSALAFFIWRRATSATKSFARDFNSLKKLTGGGTR